jgi:hypothetical protein
MMNERTLEQPRVDPGATEEPTRATFSRRRFLQTMGAAAGLTITWSSASMAARQGTAGTPVVGTPIASSEATPEGAAAPERPQPPTAVDSYLRINPDGTSHSLPAR